MSESWMFTSVWGGGCPVEDYHNLLCFTGVKKEVVLLTTTQKVTEVHDIFMKA